MIPEGRLSFYFDFASPYAYIAFEETLDIAKAAGLALDLRPVLLWALLKAQNIPPPMEAVAKAAYLRADMARSAAFLGRPYEEPERLPISAHLASRLWLGIARRAPTPAVDIARAIYRARFVEGVDICDLEALAVIAGHAGLDRRETRAILEDRDLAEALRTNVEDAASYGVPGVPCVQQGRALFFGADRLPQLRWRLGLPPRPAPPPPF